MNVANLTYTDTLLEHTFERITRYLKEQIHTTDQQVVMHKSPAELHELMDLNIPQKGVKDDAFISLMDDYLKYAVNTGHKQFLNQLYAGFNLPAFIGELITALTNTSMYTYEVAPVASLIETEMIRLMNQYSGYTNGDGIFVSGGSNANLLAMFSARNRILPQARFEGYDAGHKLTAFVNEQAHYSLDTAANILGIGANHVIKVEADKHGRMKPEALEQAISASKARGEKPFFVAATCGTTLLGAYDPLPPIAAIAKKHGLWLHADGSFGGSIILSEQHRYHIKGLELTDSFACNPHKLMNIPLICSVFLVNNGTSLASNLSDIDAAYIFHESGEAEDLGQKSIQCGRRVDAVKLWFAWKYFGIEGYRNRIDKLINMAAHAESKVKQHPQLELMAERQSFTVCFRYRPLRQTDLNDFNLRLRENVWKKGKAMVNYSYIAKDLTIRLVTANAALNQGDIDNFFQHILDEARLLEEKM